MADRNPDDIKQDIDRARDQLASTVDELAQRANPQKLADEVKLRALAFVSKPAVLVSIAGFGTVVLVVVIRKLRS